MFRAGGRRGGETWSRRWLRAQRHSRRPSLRLANRRPGEAEPQTGSTARAAAPVKRGWGSCILSKAVLDHFHRISWFKIINLKVFLKCQRNIQGHWKFRSEEFTVETPPPALSGMPGYPQGAPPTIAVGLGVSSDPPAKPTWNGRQRARHGASQRKRAAENILGTKGKRRTRPLRRQIKQTKLALHLLTKLLKTGVS